MNTKAGRWTVKKLIEELQAFPQDAGVEIEDETENVWHIVSLTFAARTVFIELQGGNPTR